MGVCFVLRCWLAGLLSCRRLACEIAPSDVAFDVDVEFDVSVAADIYFEAIRLRMYFSLATLNCCCSLVTLEVCRVFWEELGAHIPT